MAGLPYIPMPMVSPVVRSNYDGTFFSAVAIIENHFRVFPTYEGKDRITVLRNAFDRWRTDNSIVADVMAGKTTFLREYQHMLKTANRQKSSDDLGKRKEDLESCIGTIVTDTPFPYNYVLPDNPSKGFFNYAVAGLALYTILSSASRRPIERRDVLKFLALGTISGIGGASGGWTAELMKKEMLQNLESKAKYLDWTHSNIPKN